MRAPVNPGKTGVLAVAGKSGQRRGQPGGLLTWVAAVVPVRLVRDAPSRGQRPPRHAKPSLLACSSCSARVLWFCGKQARVCSVSGGIPSADRGDKKGQGGRRGRAEEGAGRSFKVIMQGLASRLLLAGGVSSLAQVKYANCLLRFPRLRICN